MTLLVTGSAGHLGEALMRTLRGRGRPARGLDRLASPYTDVVASICDAGAVSEAMAGVTAVIHAATLHKPHVASHSRQAFVDANVTGALTLLEAAMRTGVEAFVLTSTTSAFGSALTPARGEPAAWITEDVAPIPRNIYGVTKLAAESLCELFCRAYSLPAIVLRTSRFFPEGDDDPAIGGAYALENVQANELLYRRVDIEDAVAAHLLAVEHAPRLGFGRFIVSATTPFAEADLAELRADAPAVVRRLFPECGPLYAPMRWTAWRAASRSRASWRAPSARKAITGAEAPGYARPSFAFRISFTAPGLALPWVWRITW